MANIIVKIDEKGSKNGEAGQEKFFRSTRWYKQSESENKTPATTAVVRLPLV